MIYDLERVEVNKGPQGTLRGRNATAGSINFISKRPDFNALDGDVQLGFGSFDSRELEAALNVPVSDTFALRAALYHREQDNIYTNAVQSLTAENVDGVGALEQDARHTAVASALIPYATPSTSFF